MRLACTLNKVASAGRAATAGRHTHWAGRDCSCEICSCKRRSWRVVCVCAFLRKTNSANYSQILYTVNCHCQIEATLLASRLGRPGNGGGRSNCLATVSSRLVDSEPRQSHFILFHFILLLFIHCIREYNPVRSGRRQWPSLAREVQFNRTNTEGEPGQVRVSLVVAYRRCYAFNVSCTQILPVSCAPISLHKNRHDTKFTLCLSYFISYTTTTSTTTTLDHLHYCLA